MNELNALIFAANQESNHLQVHQRDLTQIDGFARASVVHLASDARDLVRLDSTAESQSAYTSATVFFNLQHVVFTVRSHQPHTLQQALRGTNWVVAPDVPLRSFAIVQCPGELGW